MREILAIDTRFLILGIAMFGVILTVIFAGVYYIGYSQGLIKGFSDKDCPKCQACFMTPNQACQDIGYEYGYVFSNSLKCYNGKEWVEVGKWRFIKRKE